MKKQELRNKHTTEQIKLCRQKITLELRITKKHFQDV